MLWKIRCLIMWAFRILNCTILTVIILRIGYLAVMDIEGFNAGLGDVTDVIGLISAVILLILIIELIGRLLSWTIPAFELPLFGDINKNRRIGYIPPF